MVIGIDISQIVYTGSGVARYVRTLVSAVIRTGREHEFVLFGASLRRRSEFTAFVRSLGADASRVKLVAVPIPPTFLDFVWNQMHILPVEWFTGPLDVFWSSDWTQPPLANARGITTIHDLSVLRYPKESHNTMSIHMKSVRVLPNIVAIQKRRLMHAARQCSVILCDSEATKNDAVRYLGVLPDRLTVVYPGLPV